MSWRSAIAQRVEAIWWERSTPLCWLKGFEPLYQWFNQRNLGRRQQLAVTVDVPVISIGNITVGGSGKTPFVLWLCDQLRDRGKQPVILCRGDGGQSEQPAKVKMSDTADQVGDEALMLAHLSGVPVVSGRDRIAGATLSAALGDVIVLDDGFQYLGLQRQCDIVLISEEGFGNGALLPAGPMREPLASLQRADLLVQNGQVDSECLHPFGRVWGWQAQPSQIVDWNKSGARLPQVVHALSGIAKPGRFHRAIEQMGITLQGTTCFPDHHIYTVKELSGWFQGDLSLLVTAKDAVKIAPLWPKDRPLWVLMQKFKAEDGLIEQILAHLQDQW